MGQYVIKLLISLVPVLILFAFYFRNFVFSRSIIWQSKAFFFGLISSVLALTLQWFLPDTSSKLVRSFVDAALVEEAVRYLFIYFRVRNSSDRFSVVEGMFDGILLGLGFAFAENLHYSLRFGGYEILLRCVSSVPMHAFASAMMGHFLSYRILCQERRPLHRRLNWYGSRGFVLAGQAFLLPFLFHGIFDYSLFQGGRWNYLIPALLIVGYTFTEYLMARGRTMPGKNVLEVLDLDADEMEIIQRQKECERWVADAQAAYDEPLPFFLNRWTIFNTAAGLALLLFSLVMFILRGSLGERYLADFNILPQTEIALIVLLPAAIAIILLTADKINYLYFREYLMRLPGGFFVSVQTETESIDTIVMDVLPRGVFITGVDSLQAGQKAVLKFSIARNKTVPVIGIVKWVNTRNFALPLGALFQFLKPGPGFVLFRMQCLFWKVRRVVVFSVLNFFSRGQGIPR
ncbi:MAG: PrsW family intramembrane metalloprotease [Spirochaetia bacterium]|nr:PrsW family intramembrane metalloprotease [Spirochaetia bacterium]